MKAKLLLFFKMLKKLYIYDKLETTKGKIDGNNRRSTKYNI